MNIQPGTELFGVWDETAGGWLCEGREHLLSNQYENDSTEFLYWQRVFGDPTHTYTVRPFIVPAPGGKE